MDKAASSRRAARDAVADVEPPRLHDVIAETLDGASMTPAVLTLDAATAIDSTADLEAISHRAAGVQLIYEGLRLTRRLAIEDLWGGGETAAETAVDTTIETTPTPNPPFETASDEHPADSQDTTSNLEILAADILVARGFYLLARTDAAGKAVRTVQSFGRDQTLRDKADADTETLDSNLERDVLELAVLTGAAAVGSTPTPALIALANDVADSVGATFPPATACLPAAGSLEAGVSVGSTDGGQPRENGTETNSQSDGSEGDTNTNTNTNTDTDTGTTPRDTAQTDRATSATDQ